jgi:nucleoside triphosphatase
MEYPEVVVGAVILNPDDEVLICRSTKWNKKYIIPGGHIELGEEMEDALKREVIEETGLEIYDIELFSLKDSLKSSDLDKHFIFIDYLCRTDSYNVKLNDEADLYKWISLDELDDYDIGVFVKILLEELRDKNSTEFKTEIFYGYK